MSLNRQEYEELFAHNGADQINAIFGVINSPQTPYVAQLTTFADLRTVIKSLEGDGYDAASELIDCFSSEEGISSFLKAFSVSDKYQITEGGLLVPKQNAVKLYTSERTTQTSYLRSDLLTKFDKLKNVFRHRIEQAGIKFDTDLVINSGYRSSAYQLGIFAYYVSIETNNAVAEVIKNTAAPGTSQHASWPQHAIDIAQFKRHSPSNPLGARVDFDNEIFDLPAYQVFEESLKELETFELSYPRGHSVANGEPWEIKPKAA